MKKIFTILGIATISVAMNAQIVINEVYGGGGNSGSTYMNDFVELINRGTAPVTLTGATLQYASATGTFNQYHTLPSITLAPGQTYLVQEAAGAGGTVALSADYVAPAPINFNGSTSPSAPGFAMSGTNMKMALVSDATQINGPTDANVLDFVGTGTASQYEGTAAAPVMSNTTSASRTNGVDTNNNVADFTIGTPTPTNSTLGVSDVINVKSNFVQNTFVADEIKFGAKSDVKIYNMNGQVVKAASVSEFRALDASDLQPGMYIVTGSVEGQPVSQKILKK